MTPSAAWSVLRQVPRHPRVFAASLLLVTIVACAVAGPWLSPYHYSEPAGPPFAEPSWNHWFGTDVLGRDVLTRTLHGARISLLVGCVGALVSLVIGVSWGAIAAQAGGRTDAVMMRIVDVLYSIPRLIFVLLLIAVLDQNVRATLESSGLEQWTNQARLILLFAGLGLVEWLTMARIVRGEVLSLKERPFVTAARALGQRPAIVLVRHILPNLIGVVVVYLTLTVPVVILQESFLSFLGLGVQAPMASWGTLIADGAQVINPVESHWWLLVFPSLALALTLLALNFLGDGLRDWLDPRSRART